MPDDDLCTLCQHDFNAHAMVATNDHDPKKGGVMVCPVKGCECFSTWGVPELGTDREDVVIPDDAEMARIREFIQSRP